MPEQTTEKNKLEIQRLLGTLDPDRLTKQDFVNTFDQVVQFLLSMEQKNEFELSYLSEQMRSVHDSNVGESKTELTSLRDQLNTYVQKNLRTLKKEQTQKLNDFDTRLSIIEDNTPSKEEIITETLTRIPDVEFPDELTAEKVKNKLESLKGKERLDRKAIKGLEGISEKKDVDRALSILDERTQFLINKQSNSGTPTNITGFITAGSNITITGSGTLASPYNIAAAGGGSGFTFLAPTGTVDGNNRVFTFAQTPAYVVADGVWYRATDKNGGVNWSGTTTVTMTIPPTSDIWGFV